MVVRAFALSLLIAASLADSSGAHSAAIFFLLAAVPVIGMGGLMAFGNLADTRELGGKIVAGAQALLSFLALALTIIVIGSNSGPLFDVPVPALGVSALGACLGVFAAQCTGSSRENASSSASALCPRWREFRHRRAHRALGSLLGLRAPR